GNTTASDQFTLNATLVLAATSPTTTDNRLYNTAGTLFWDGEAISGSTTGSWIVDGADVYRASGNVGIGLSSPTVRLQVAGGDVQFNDLSDNPAFYFDESTGRTGLGTSTPTNLLTVAGTLGAATLCDEYGGNCASVTALTSGTSPWSQAGSDIYYTAGNIGIGTTTPAGDLTVEDTAFADIFIRSTASNSDAKMHLINDAGSWAITNEGDKNDAFSIIDNTAGLSRFSINSAGEISIGTTTNEALLTVQTYASRDIFSLLETNGEEVFVVRENGNVGIGTTSPDYPLDVDGQIRLNGVASNFDLLFASNGQNEWSINGDGARIAISEAGVGEHFRVQTGGNIG
ncbi:MAG TPA: hypothetical protein VKP88_02590, partial [Candidatus Paceibacterota bacterium]|nr:hypothetical protein [Candidatus Paceibacterota bacterium]